jgi:shikimate dehydrogenase
MQNAALAELGLAGEWSYEAIEVVPEEFADLVRSLADDGFAGVNITVPHKLAALALADRASTAAREIGAANTLTFTDAGIDAENTDAGGLIAALPEPPGGRRALVLGAGGSARAAVWALGNAGASVSVWNRTTARAEVLAAEFGVVHERGGASGEPLPLADYDLLVNCTTVGLAASSATAGGPGDLEPLPLRADSVQATQLVVDLAYGPSATPLIAAASSRGARVVDGLEVLVHQGAASLRIWTGLDAPLETMRRAARAP